MQNFALLIPILFILNSSAYADEISSLKKVIAIQQARLQELSSKVALLEKNTNTHSATIKKNKDSIASVKTTAETAKTNASNSSKKTCYLTSNAHGNRWGTCKHGGTYRGGFNIKGIFAGYSSENNWKEASYQWLCCS